MSEAETYDLGDLVRVSVEFTSKLTGLALDPGTVNLNILAPDGTVAEYVFGVDAIIVKDSTGNYHADLDVEQAGTWYYRWWSTGTGQAAIEVPFDVRPAYAVD